MDRVNLGPVKGLRIAIAAFMLSLVLLLAVLGLGAYLVAHKTQTNAQNAEEIRRGLVENCAANGNPLREVVQGLLKEQIRNSESPVVEELFPQIPPDLLRLHISADRRRLAEIAPVNCSAQYPAP